MQLQPSAESLNVVGDAFEKKVGAPFEPGDGGVGHLQLFRQFNYKLTLSSFCSPWTISMRINT